MPAAGSSLRAARRAFPAFGFVPMDEPHANAQQGHGKEPHDKPPRDDRVRDPLTAELNQLQVPS